MANNNGLENSLIFSLITLYVSAAMFKEFGDAISSILGPTIGVILSMVAFLYYADKNQAKINSAQGNYNQSERSTILRDENGKLQEVPITENRAKGIGRGVFYVIFAVVILGSELTWANLIF